MKKPAKKKTSAKAAPAKKSAPAGKKSAPKPAAKAPRPAAPAATKPADVGRYTPGDISGVGWKPFRYPPD